MRFFICTLPYCNTSTGIRVLHKLSNLIAQKGYESYTVESYSGQQFVEEDDIVIYPKSWKNNILNAKKIVRYLLSPTQELEINYNEYNIPFLKCFYPQCNKELFINTVEPFFKNNNLKREKDAVWIGKGKAYNYPFTIDPILITYGNPPTRKKLAEVLNTVENFYTFDDLTMLSYEAFLCGCNVYLINQNKTIIKQKIEFPPSKEEQEKQLLSFLKDMKNL